MGRRRFNELPVEGKAAGLPNLEVRIGALLLRAMASVHRLVVAAFDWQWKRHLRAEERRVWAETFRAKGPISVPARRVPSMIGPTRPSTPSGHPDRGRGRRQPAKALTSAAIARPRARCWSRSRCTPSTGEEYSSPRFRHRRRPRCVVPPVPCRAAPGRAPWVGAFEPGREPVGAWRRRWADRRRLRRLGPGRHDRPDRIEKDARAHRDIIRGQAELRLEIVGAEHDDHHVERPMTFNTRLEIGLSILVDTLDRIVMNRGAARQTFLDQSPTGAQCLGHHAGPALVRAEAADIVERLHRRLAEGVEVAVAQDPFHRFFSPLNRARSRDGTALNHNLWMLKAEAILLEQSVVSS